MKTFLIRTTNSKGEECIMHQTACLAIAEYCKTEWEKKGYKVRIYEFDIITQGKNYGKLAVQKEIIEKAVI